jgi:ketosteroid isomerase-like protein
MAALYTEDGVNVLPGGASHGRQAIEKGWARVFQSWHPSNDIATFDRSKAVGNEVRSSGRWSHTDTPTGSPPSNRQGSFTWIMVREGDTWKIRWATFSDTTP